MEALAKLHSWMFMPVRKVADQLKTGQKLTAELEEKIQDRIYKQDEQDNLGAYEVLHAQGAFDPQSKGFMPRFFAFQMLNLPGSQHFSKFLSRVRDYFDAKSVEGLIQTYTHCVSVLNLDSRAATPEA